MLAWGYFTDHSLSLQINIHQPLSPRITLSLNLSSSLKIDTLSHFIMVVLYHTAVIYGPVLYLKSIWCISNRYALSSIFDRIRSKLEVHLCWSSIWVNLPNRMDTALTYILTSKDEEIMEQQWDLNRFWYLFVSKNMPNKAVTLQSSIGLGLKFSGSTLNY